ncbi:hypothetical protein K432DRAFT_78623 [Lepidopterella palustris CBS 459.81]|uniref:Uncharacterized protein n=1 Tax=Lepidopterella palustris CBS 459.81 TaxID=1314670 RepID=A0A8E2E7Z6_9PEZI|nr:hypothetical protein K432DRAFT_78623 [Lepidopterella palustris CBS 459.81]
MPNEPRLESEKPSHVCCEQVVLLDRNIEHQGDVRKVSDYIKEIEMVMESTVPKTAARGAEGGGQVRIEADIGGPDRWDILGRQWLTLAISTPVLEALPLAEILNELGAVRKPDIEPRSRFALIFNIWGFNSELA